MTSKERVKCAVHFNAPDKMPIMYFNDKFECSDIIAVEYNHASDFKPSLTGESEWGFVWETVDGTMGQPKNPPITDYEKLSEYHIPNPNDPARYADIPAKIEKYKDRYIIGRVGEKTVSGFNIATYIRGFEDFLEDLYLEPDELMRVVKIVFDFEMSVIENFAQIGGIDAIAFGDDWGTQNSLMISPAIFREYFKPLYKTQFDLCHKYGMDVYFHSCGQINQIIPDLIDIGVDIFNFNQPDIFKIEKLALDYGGKVCFNCPVDHQTVAIKGTKSEIFDYVSRLNGCLGKYSGGFIGYIERYESIGLSDENYGYIIEAFEKEKNIKG